MIKIACLTIEDELGEEISRRIHQDLEDWLFVTRGIVELHGGALQERKWVTNLAEWRQRVDGLTASNDLVFCTVDLCIPEGAGESRADPKNGLTIVHEIEARKDQGLRCCVLTGMDSTEVEKLVGKVIPDVLFDFKIDSRRHRNVVNDIKSKTLAAIESLEFTVDGGEPQNVLLKEPSGLLRQAFLSKAVYYADRATWHVPTLVLGAQGLGRSTLARFIAFLASARLEKVNFGSLSFQENRRIYRSLCDLADALSSSSPAPQDRLLLYIADLDRYEPGISGDGAENCLEPLARILETLDALGSTHEAGFPLGLVVSVSGQSRLRVRSPETRAFIQGIEDTIGRTTDFPLRHLARDINGWPEDHPRIVRLPSMPQRGRAFVEDLIHRRLETFSRRLTDRLPAYRGERLSLSDEVLDLLIDKMEWPKHGRLGGLVAATDAAFEGFLNQRAAHQYQITRAHLDKSLSALLHKQILNLDEVILSFPTSGGEDLLVVERADFFVEDGELLVLVGPSGCGKSTILRMLAGLLLPTSGTVTFRGDEILEPTKKIGFVFQDYSLFPWLDVRRNVEFGPRITGQLDGKASARIEELLSVAGLTSFESAYSRQLSGGMQQRAAIVRAIANDPDVLLMDEPFSALDVETRWRMQEFLLRIKASTGKTIVFVTHDIDEAVFLADRVYVTTPRPMQICEEAFRMPFALEDRREALRSDHIFAAQVNRIRDSLLGEVRRPALSAGAL